MCLAVLHMNSYLTLYKTACLYYITSKEFMRHNRGKRKLLFIFSSLFLVFARYFSWRRIVHARHMQIHNIFGFDCDWKKINNLVCTHQIYLINKCIMYTYIIYRSIILLFCFAYCLSLKKESNTLFIIYKQEKATKHKVETLYISIMYIHP